MDEFVGRMTTQRRILEIVNSNIDGEEQLFGLSAGAIQRWELANQGYVSTEVAELLRNLSYELFFMATHSQEPVSNEYKTRSQTIISLVRQLEGTV